MLRGNLPEVFIDTDVAFDILSKRKPHYQVSVKFLEFLIQGKIEVFISESCVSNLIYLSMDIYKLKNAGSKLQDFILATNVISAGKATILRALNSAFKDKEDAIQYFSALNHGVDYFVTRNIKDYKHTVQSLPAMTPSEYIKAI